MPVSKTDHLRRKLKYSPLEYLFVSILKSWACPTRIGIFLRIILGIIFVILIPFVSQLLTESYFVFWFSLPAVFLRDIYKILSITMTAKEFFLYLSLIILVIGLYLLLIHTIMTPELTPERTRELMSIVPILSMLFVFARKLTEYVGNLFPAKEKK